jgi:tRNA threonylcarbamoyl adenosine modification protein YeaZ
MTTLVLDTSTRTPVVALATADGELLGERHWASHHRQGEELLQHVGELLTEAQVGPDQVSAVVVGTGPGSFTGLRIGLATAKTIAYSLSIPIVGISSTVALARAAATAHGARTELTVTLPAGASDRYEQRVRIENGQATQVDAPQLVAGGEIAIGDVAIDLEYAPDEARTRGNEALAGLASALAVLGAARLAAGDADDVAALVPAYVALPRGIARVTVEMEWSPDLR